MTSQPHRIDTHHHILPKEWVQAVSSLGIGDAGGIEFPRWSAESALSLMDRCGIATAITSISAPGVYFGDLGFARSLARRCNDISARLVQEHPQRFGAFAFLPLPDVDASLKELEYALDTLRLDGVVLLASIGDRYLGDPAFDALFDELNRRKTVVFVHPTTPASSSVLKLNLPGTMVEFVFDTTRAAANLVFSGTMERCPDLRIILSHAGGTIPFVADRLALVGQLPALHEKAPKGAIAYLKRFYYDTALSATPYALNSLRELVDPSHILFGSDYPYLPEPYIHESIKGLKDYQAFDDATRMRIERGSALALFPRLRAV